MDRKTEIHLKLFLLCTQVCLRRLSQEKGDKARSLSKVKGVSKARTEMKGRLEKIDRPANYMGGIWLLPNQARKCFEWHYFPTTRTLRSSYERTTNPIGFSRDPQIIGIGKVGIPEGLGRFSGFVWDFFLPG